MKTNRFFVIGFFLAFPIFLTADMAVFDGNSFSGTFALPLSIFVVAILFFIFLWRSLEIFTQINSLAFLFILLLFGLTSAIQLRDGDWSLFLVYFVPLFLGFYFSTNVQIKSTETLLNVFRGFSIALVVAALLHLASSFFSYGFLGAFVNRGEDSIFGLFSIYQKYIYYATLLSFAFFILIFLQKGFLRLVGATVLFLDIIMIGSRESLVLVTFFTLVTGFSGGKSLSLKFSFFIKSISIFILIILLTVFFIGDDINDLMFVMKIMDIINASDSSELTAGRSEVIFNVISEFHIDEYFWLFGSGFRTDVGELGTPHNQYIEWFLRGGMSFLFLNLICIILAMYYYLKSNERVQNAAGFMLLSTILISNNINTPFRVPYASVWLWILIGAAFNIKLKKINKNYNLMN